MPDPKFPNPTERIPLSKEDERGLSVAKRVLETLMTASDELPEEFIVNHGDYKFRGTWFQGAFSACASVAEILNDEDFEKEVQAAITKRRAKSDTDRTTRQEIIDAEDLVNRALKKIEKALG